MNLKMFLISALVVSGVGRMAAQDFDDIYYDSSHSNTSKTTSATTVAPANNSYNYAGTVNGRDIDEYNRRGTTNGNYTAQQPDTVYSDNGGAGNGYSDYTYTMRIQRFYNPTIVIESSDPALLTALVAPAYAAATFGTILSPFSSLYWGWDYYPASYYAWNAWNNPWYYGGWNWGWHSSWYWGDPYWNYGWWGGCPPYHHHHYHDYYRPYYHDYGWHGNRPRPYYGNGYTGDGGRRPIGYSNGNGRTPVGSHDNSGYGGRRPNTQVGNGGNGYSGDGGRRPNTQNNGASDSRGNSGSYNSGGGNYNNNGGGSYNGGYNGHRGSSNGNSSSQGRTPSYNNNNNRRENSYNRETPSYNRGGSYNNGGSYGGGSHRGSSGGGSYGGGGGHRGGGRR